MFTIGQLVEQFKLSRSTLLYYDSIGLLRPSARSDANYRLYSEKDQEKLKKICIYREVGIPLSDIKKILNSSKNNNVLILEKQLEELNNQIKEYRRQQKIIIKMLEDKKYLKSIQGVSRETLTLLLKSISSAESVEKFHKNFELNFPEEHQYFLEMMGLEEEEVKRIRDSYSEK